MNAVAALCHLSRSVHTGRSVPVTAGQQLHVTPDDDDPEGQSLLLAYPPVSDEHAYVRPAVKIEAGAKSALDPHQPLSVTPYSAGDLKDFDLTVPNVTTVNPVRTLWDKVLILHSLRQSFEDRGVLRGGGQRVSRHYYDVYRMLRTELGQRARTDLTMAADCARHERMFFPRAGQNTALPGSFTLAPHGAMLDQLRQDYAAMTVMIFGDVPTFDAVMESIMSLESAVNQ